MIACIRISEVNDQQIVNYAARLQGALGEWNVILISNDNLIHPLAAAEKVRAIGHSRSHVFDFIDKLVKAIDSDEPFDKSFRRIAQEMVNKTSTSAKAPVSSRHPPYQSADSFTSSRSNVTRSPSYPSHSSPSRTEPAQRGSAPQSSSNSQPLRSSQNPSSSPPPSVHPPPSSTMSPSRPSQSDLQKPTSPPHNPKRKAEEAPEEGRNDSKRPRLSPTRSGGRSQGSNDSHQGRNDHRRSNEDSMNYVDPYLRDRAGHGGAPWMSSQGNYRDGRLNNLDNREPQRHDGPRSGDNRSSFDRAASNPSNSPLPQHQGYRIQPLYGNDRGSPSVNSFAPAHGYHHAAPPPNNNRNNSSPSRGGRGSSSDYRGSPSGRR